MSCPPRPLPEPPLRGRMPALLALITLCLLLAGCGFALRRELALPTGVEQIRITGIDPGSALAGHLQQALRRAGAEPSSDSAPAARLQLDNLRSTHRPLSVSGGGRVQEYALAYAIEVRLIDVAGLERVPMRRIELERVYAFDSAQALGSPGEEETIRAELERDLAAAILRQVEAALRPPD